MKGNQFNYSLDDESHHSLMVQLFNSNESHKSQCCNKLARRRTKLGLNSSLEISSTFVSNISLNEVIFHFCFQYILVSPLPSSYVTIAEGRVLCARLFTFVWCQYTCDSVFLRHCCVWMTTSKLLLLVLVARAGFATPVISAKDSCWAESI